MTTFSESEAEQLALKLLERLSWTVKYDLDFILTDAPAHDTIGASVRRGSAKL